MPTYIQCHFCSEKATRRDDVYCPTTVYVCDGSDCLNQAMDALWTDASVEVDEEEHQLEGEEHDE